MKRVALKIEHRYKNRILAIHTIDGRHERAVVGSSRSADLRLVGEDVAGIHAMFERDENGWKVSDLGSESGTWIQQRPIIEHEISGATVIHIGGHQLKATPHVLDRDLFATPVDGAKQGQIYHQVVVLKNKLVIQSELLPKTKPFTFSWEDVEKTLPAPNGEGWMDHTFGDVVVKQRLTKAERVVESAKDRLSRSIEPRVHGPFLSALGVFVLIFLMFVFFPHKPDDQMKTLTPAMQNEYTRLIFDGKNVRRNRLESQKLQKVVAKAAPKGASGSHPIARVSERRHESPGARVVNNIKAAGLGALIGKISKRAAKSGVFLQAAGVSPDHKGSGHALGLGNGSALDRLAQHGGGRGKFERIAGVGTIGRGAGHAGYKGSGALSLGGVGNAQVGVIQDETEIEGGLDKDVIARVIKSELGQIRYCYERQLSANPNLYGKILVKFTIGSAGSVIMQSIGNSSMNNSMVEGCILRRVASWHFPTPKGGTNVLVTYPFLFKSTR